MIPLDITDTLAPTSDQLDAVDLLGGPRTFTIEAVSKGNAEQPVNIKLAEFPRVWRPGKSMRRVLAFAWGPDASQWVGRRVTLYCDTEVMFGKEKVGGTRISHLSHIDKRLSVPLIVTRGRSTTYKVEPLVEAAPPQQQMQEPTAEQVAECSDQQQLRQWWQVAGAERRAEIEARVNVLREPPVDDGAMFPQEQS